MSDWNLSIRQSLAIYKVLQGTFHQGSDIFSANSRGRQCVANTFLSCVYRHVSSKPLIDWTSNGIDNILLNGDILYLHTRLFYNSVYLEPSQLPTNLCLEGQIVKCSVVATYSGDIGVSFKDSGDFYSLETALSLCLGDISHKGILICNNNAIALRYCEPYFHVFDSHAKDAAGKTFAEGTASMLTVQTFQQLHVLLRHIFDLKERCAFDLHKIQTSTVVNKKHCYQKDYSNKICFSKKMSTGDHHCITCEPFLFTNQTNKNTNRIHKRTLAERFHRAVKSGPDYVCKSCMQIWFREGVQYAAGVAENMCSRCNLLEKDWVCRTCYGYLKSNKIPPSSHLNGLSFPAKPPELDLTLLEERLVSPRKPFMQWREKPLGGQLSILGNVVNVPADVTSTVKKLPRLLSDDETIRLQFKRSLSFKHSVAFEQVRPNKVIADAKWPVDNSDLFRNEGIQINDEWINSQHFDHHEISDASCVSSHDNINTETHGDDVIDSWTEDSSIDDRPTGNMDTVMQSLDFREFNEVLVVAPGENNRPLGVFQDKNSELLSFPTIYCGQTRPDNKSRLVPLHYSTICKWELRNVDRRSATCIPNLFFKMKKLQIKHIQDKVMLALRKCKLQGKKYTVAQILDQSITESIVHLNEGYQVLRTLRGSPLYWEKTKKDVFAMIRQIGLPTWFCSFSAAETKWSPLLVTLARLIDKTEYSEEQAANLTWEHKCRLIKADPVTCARYFDYRSDFNGLWQRFCLIVHILWVKLLIISTG